MSMSRTQTWLALNRVRVAPDMRFRIGTASTALTSAAVGQLLEKERLKPRYRYSSYGGILVSAAVEAAAHEPFLTFMRKQIFEPLGMDDTRADSATKPITNRATPYFPRFGADPRYGLHLMRPLDYSCYAGASAFLSTPSDLVRFAMAINSRLRQGSGAQGGKLLQPATVQLFQTSQRLASGEETGYGLGWDLETAALTGKQTHLVGHDGESLGGMVASFMTFPEQGIVVAVNVEHLLRGHVLSWGENRAGVRGTREKSVGPGFTPTVAIRYPCRRNAGTRLSSHTNGCRSARVTRVSASALTRV